MSDIRKYIEITSEFSRFFSLIFLKILNIHFNLLTLRVKEMLPTEILLLDSDAPKTGRIDGISFDTTPPDALILLSVGILCYRISSETNSIINFIKDNIEINVVTTPPDFSSTTTTCQQTTDFIQAQISAAPPSSNTQPQSPCTVTVVLNTSSFNESTMYVFKATQEQCSCNSR